MAGSLFLFSIISNLVFSERLFFFYTHNYNTQLLNMGLLDSVKIQDAWYSKTLAKLLVFVHCNIWDVCILKFVVICLKLKFNGMFCSPEIQLW